MNEYDDRFTRVEVTRVTDSRVYATAYTNNPLVAYNLVIACNCEGGKINTRVGVGWITRKLAHFRSRSRCVPWTSKDWIVVIESLEKFFGVLLDRPRV